MTLLAWIDYDPASQFDDALLVLTMVRGGLLGFRDLGKVAPEDVAADPWPGADSRYRGLCAFKDKADEVLAEEWGVVRVEEWRECARGYVAEVREA